MERGHEARVVKREEKEQTGKARRRMKEGAPPRTGKQGPRWASGAGTPGGTQRTEDKHEEPRLEHPGHGREVR